MYTHIKLYYIIHIIILYNTHNYILYIHIIILYIYIYIYIYTCTCKHTLHRDRRQQINCLHRCCRQWLLSSCTCIQVANMYSSSNIIASIACIVKAVV